MYTYGAISTGDFYRRLKVLNPRLRICDFGGNGRLAGLYLLGHDGEDYFSICGVDKGFVPEYTEWDAQGHIVKSGWRRVAYIVMQLHLTTAERVQKAFPGFFLHKAQYVVDKARAVKLVGDPIGNKLQKYAENAPVRRWRDPETGKVVEGTALTDEQNLELAKDIQQHDPNWKKEQDAHDRWFLETWRNHGGNTSDKPNY